VKELFIIRGLPGSGKTTLARKIANVVCEADQFFYEFGEYKFDKERLGDAHSFCRDKAERMMKEGIETIAVSNTSIRRWEFEPYERLAEKYGYSVTVIRVDGKHRSTHGVPAEKIEMMRNNWED